MDPEPVTSLLIRAREAYRRAVADPEGYAPEADRLIAESRAGRDDQALAYALRAAAWARRFLHRHDEARVMLDEAVRVARRAGAPALLGDVLVTRGAVNHELGRLASARRDLDRAAGLIAPEAAAELASQRAALAQNTGRLAEAATLYRQVLADPTTPADVRTKAANNLGIIEVQCGRPRAGMASFDLAAATAEQVGPAAVAIVAEGRAWATVQAGLLAEGLALFERAVRLWTEAGLPLGELYAEYADALADLRLVPEAAEVATRAAAMLDGRGLDLMAAEAQLRVARLATLRGDLASAGAAAAAGVEQLRRQRRTAWLARARLAAVEVALQAGTAGAADLTAARRAAGTLRRAGLSAAAVEGYLVAGRVARALGRPAEAVRCWQEAYALGRGGAVLVRLNGRLAAALAADAAGRDDLVLRQASAGLRDLSRHRAALGSTELRALASGHGAELGALGLSARVRSGVPARVLEWMERTRSAALATLEPAEEAAGPELGALRAAQAQIAQARRDTGVEPPALVAQLRSLEDQLRQAAWTRGPRGSRTGRLATRDAGYAPSVADLRGLLGDRVLVEYDVLHGQLLAVVLDRRRTRLVRLGALAPVAAQSGALLFLLRSASRGGPAPALSRLAAGTRDALARLADALLAPLALAEHGELVVVPVGELQRLPWSALHDRPVSVAPSAALWARGRRAAGAGPGRTVLVAGPDLPGAVEEVSALGAVHPGAAVLVPPQATVDAVVHELDGAGLAHLACHGTVRVDNPTFSSLLLADGELTVHELDLRGGVPHRLVLAACDVGSSVTYPGNEALGFVGTLLARGTAGLVASTVLVPDVESTPLMRALHEELAAGAGPQTSLAAALHAARARTDTSDAASLAAWCAFTAYGAA